MSNVDRYAITVRKVLVEGEELWRATAREFPDLEEYAETREEALDLAADLIESLKETADQEGSTFPEPIEDEEEYTGRVTLRMPKTLHRTVAQRAMDQGVSLNTYMVSCLAVSLTEYTRAFRADAPDWVQQTLSPAVEGNLYVLPNASAITAGAWYMESTTQAPHMRIMQIPIGVDPAPDLSQAHVAPNRPSARNQARRRA